MNFLHQPLLLFSNMPMDFPRFCFLCLHWKNHWTQGQRSAEWAPEKYEIIATGQFGQ
jgi:hypothetical protein